MGLDNSFAFGGFELLRLCGSPAVLGSHHVDESRTKAGFGYEQRYLTVLCFFGVTCPLPSGSASVVTILMALSC